MEITSSTIFTRFSATVASVNAGLVLLILKWSPRLTQLPIKKCIIYNPAAHFVARRRKTTKARGIKISKNITSSPWRLVYSIDPNGVYLQIEAWKGRGYR